MSSERRLATLLAFTRAFALLAMDDALDVFDLFMSDITRDAHQDGEKERLRTVHDLDAAALQLWDALQMLLDENVDAAAVRSRTFAQIPRERVLNAGSQGEQLAAAP